MSMTLFQMIYHDLITNSFEDRHQIYTSLKLSVVIAAFYFLKAETPRTGTEETKNSINEAVANTGHCCYV